jgi:DoxX-like family
MLSPTQSVSLSSAQTVSTSKTTLWAGRIITALVALFLLFDSVGHLIVPAPVAEAFARLGFPLSLSHGLGIIELVCIVIYVIPRTSILGAILLTGYLGGATAAQVRVDNPLFETLFPAIFGVLIWAGVYLREDRLRALIPMRR